MAQTEKLLCLLTWLLLLLPDRVLIRYCFYTFFSSPHSILGLSPLGLFLFSIFHLSLILTFASHIRCWLSNPGYTPKFIPVFPDSPICQFCNQYKPLRSHHCKSCQKCVHKMDHHCIWVNNCIGAMNQKYFILFLFYTALTSATGLFILFICIISVNEINFTKETLPTIMVVAVAGLQGVFFMYYAGDYLFEQLESVMENQTCVESHQRKRGIYRSLERNFTSVFGDNPWFWLLPTTPDIELTYDEDIIVDNTGLGNKYKSD